mmetsp:Transcript_101821/g.199711  ORF Transcript_101821/g.199711 Transcript_101821/m.199711 type:complete len:331 (+) Transcript_101821:90-1082(+)
MFRVASVKGGLTGVKQYISSYCDEHDEEEDHIGNAEPDDYNDGGDIVQQANELAGQSKAKIRTPMQYEDLRGALQGCSVNNYDGFRFIVQKQVNLNTAVSHFYWLGSAAMQGNPLYQYRVILPLDDDKVVQVATDLDFNVEGDLKLGVTPNMMVKTSFAHSQQQQMLAIEANLQDESSTAQVKFTRSAGDELSFSFMQMIYPNISLGGMSTYNVKGQSLSNSIGLYIDPTDFTLAVQYDNTLKMMYMRKVNPNRVHLGADLTVDEQGQATMGMIAEYQLKQAKLQLGLDSSLVVRSQLDTTLMPGTQMQLCAEMQQAANVYRFGFGIVMG